MKYTSSGIGWGQALVRCLFLGVSLFLVFACDEERKKGIKEMKVYNGPLIESENIVSLYSDSAKVKIKLEGKKQAQYENGNIEYPEGVKVTFFDDYTRPKAVLSARQGYYYKEKQLYRAVGEVWVKDLKENKSLQTEELFWSPKDKKIYTDKFVIITTPTEIIKGEGLVASEDFSYYEIQKPTGIIALDEEVE
jgi:LPS export ABC transporter protein LptC